jgi:hypothetical protein
LVRRQSSGQRIAATGIGADEISIERVRPFFTRIAGA